MVNFNSIKVRLKLIFKRHSLLGKEFQFHKGTIKTSSSALRLTIGSRFQFHKGTIKTSISCASPKRISYFNSIKVRLKRTRSNLTSIQAIFQFHKGTIKTYFWWWTFASFLHFNSIKVRLKHKYDGADNDQFNFNSIKVRLKQCSWN